MSEKNKYGNQVVRQDMNGIIEKIEEILTGDEEFKSEIPSFIIMDGKNECQLINDFCVNYASMIYRYNVLPQKSSTKLVYLDLSNISEREELVNKLQAVYDAEPYKNAYFGTMCVIFDSEKIFIDDSLKTMLGNFIKENSRNIKFVFRIENIKLYEDIYRFVNEIVKVEKIELERGTVEYGRLLVQSLKNKYVEVEEACEKYIVDYFDATPIVSRYQEEDGIERLTRDICYLLCIEKRFQNRITLENVTEILELIGIESKSISKSKMGFR